MIDEKILLIEKLRDNADKFLLEKLSQDIGPLHDQYQKELGEKLYAWMRWAIHYYSTTELNKIYKEFCARYPGVFFAISADDYQKIADLDELKYLEIHNARNIPPMGNLGYSQLYHKSNTSPTGNIWTYLSQRSNINHLSNMAKQIRLSEDKRKMRRLKRKEAKLRKKGIRLFDSN